MRAFGSACETQGSHVTEVALSHSSLSTLLACSSSPGFCRELVWQAGLGVTLSVPAAPPGFSRASAQGTFWPNCSFILSRRLHGLEESQSLLEGLQNQACGLLLPPPAPAEGRGAVKLLDARNECELLPSTLCFPPSGNALVWASLFLII